jgi:hypothetical protein
MPFGRIETIIISLLALLVIRTTATILHNLFFSPLRTIPGPKWYAATPFPRLWLYISGREPWVVKSMHERYGPVVRLAPMEVSFIDEQAWKDIYGYRATTHKDATFYPLSPSAKHSLILADDETHPWMRRMFRPAFSAKALRKQTGMLKDHVVRLVGDLEARREAGQVIGLVKIYNLTTYVSRISGSVDAADY